MSNDFKFVTRSTINTRETAEFEGKTYPLAKIEVSSESHPFYTGQQKIMDTAGRVEKFQRSKDIDWKPYVASLLGLPGDLMLSK